MQLPWLLLRHQGRAMTFHSRARQQVFRLRLTDAESDQFERVAKTLHLSVSSMLRMLVQLEDDRLAGHILTHRTPARGVRPNAK